MREPSRSTRASSPTDVGQLSEVRIEVPAEQAADALRLLADSESAVAEGSDFPPPEPRGGMSPL